MRPRFIRFLLSPVVLLLSAAALEAGGWAVITVTDLPDYVVVGQPVTLTYAVRQHGQRLLGGLDGRLEMHLGAHTIRAAATATSDPGYYRAAFTLPHRGNWTVDIFGGWTDGTNRAQVEIQALKSSSASGAARVVTDVERGRRLFTGKGCVTCHVHRAAKGISISTGAPELTAKRFQPEYLRRLLVNPPQADEPGGWAMPDLKLRDGEIASLVAFINAEQRTAGRTAAR